MHLLPAERSGHRVIDGERVCQAIESLGGGDDIKARAKIFALLGDPTRLTLLTCIKAAGPISVSDHDEVLLADLVPCPKEADVAWRDTNY